MNVRQLILQKLRNQPSVRAAEVIKITGFSREYVNRFFRALVTEGKLNRLGKANQARYVLEGRKFKKVLVPITTHRKLANQDLREDVVLAEIEHSARALAGVPENVRRIMEYAFTEMLNNAIEHSRSREISVVINRQTASVGFEVTDRGIGIFNNIRQKRKLKGVLEAIQDLLKGKQTTAPRQHSGEGIFFTSKIADVLTIQSSGKKLIFNNVVGDIFIRDIRPARGTKVSFSIGVKSKRNLQKVFKNYSGEAYGFTKTRVGVKLYELSSEYISRSQARRIMSGLEKFKHVTLDFRGVKTVGQGFADEVFRVWQKNHPSITIEPKNMNDNVRFMTTRAQNE